MLSPGDAFSCDVAAVACNDPRCCPAALAFAGRAVAGGRAGAEAGGRLAVEVSCLAAGSAAAAVVVVVVTFARPFLAAREEGHSLAKCPGYQQL